MLKNRKKILYLVTQSDFGGAQRYVFDMATNLAYRQAGISQKHDIIVAGGEQCEQGELAKKLKRENIDYFPISHLKRAILPWHDIMAFWQIIKLIKVEKPDIIHLNSSKISILGSLASKWYKVPKVVYTVHGWVFNEQLSGWKKIFYKKSEKWTAKFKTNIICLSNFDKQNAIEQKIAKSKKISIINNGIKPTNFLSRDEARKKLKISPDATIIGSIGNLYKNKGFKYLIKAINKLRTLPTGRQVTNYELFIIGNGPEEKNLKSEILNLKLDDKIKLFGEITNAAKFLPAFNIYVCSSIKEGFPYSILEAMQAGLPIVSTNVGAIPEMITDGKEGLLVEPKNPEALAEKIKYLINNPDIAKKLGKNAKEKVKQFSLEKMIKETEDLYNI